ncbi:multidrug ABC transporter ATP-binding protein [Paenibacillus sp. D9]|uniref:ABC transporter ATP-binding protein n=1 Tax=Paenibacillus sp. D9 TaxID=665792 RepID=UPI00061FC9C2|nr:ABC transporter ATP-binding protein [Paenibacillus sp. D9]KKC46639.1 multidrug ABC transporter ATP-binding protein [Paenibacillus sp. D9]
MFKLFRLLKPFRLQIAAVLALVFCQSLSDLYLPTLLSDIVDKGILKGDVPYIWRIGGFMLLVSAAGAACIIASSFLSSRVASGFGRSARSKLFAHAEKFSLPEFDRIGTASMINRTTNDVNQVQQVLIMMMRMMVSAPMMCIGGLIMAFSKDAKLSLLLVVVIPVIGLTIFAVMRKAIPLFRAMQVKLDKLNLVLREGLTGIRVIRSFNRGEYEQGRFDSASRDLADTALRVNRMMAILMPTMMLIMNLTTVLIVWFGAKRIDAGDMNIGSLIAFIQYASQIMFSLVMMSMMFAMVPRAATSAARINEMLDIAPTITDGQAKPSPAASPRTGAARGEVEFREVSFHYPGAERPALDRVSFTARAGETTAVIGGTGSGKTTLLNLIMRFYDAGEGEVRVGGRDVRSLSQEELRAGIGLVPQKALLFSGSVSGNIRYGKEDATDAEVRHAAEVAQAAGFVEAMPEGFSTDIAQGGANLSGGQKQRLSIARALVRRPDLYLFDDSFSALDASTESRLRAALAEETGGAAVLVVAQRVSSVMGADRILVLDEGRLAGDGTHAELMESCGVYREIVESQLRTEEESA